MHPPDEEEAETVTLWVTPEERRHLEVAATLLGVTVEEFVCVAAHEAALCDTAPQKSNRLVMGIEDFTDADVQAIHNAEPPPEAGAFDQEQLDQIIAEVRAKFADLPPEELQSLLGEAMAAARLPTRKRV